MGAPQDNVRDRSALIVKQYLEKLVGLPARRLTARLQRKQPNLTSDEFPQLACYPKRFDLHPNYLSLPASSTRRAIGPNLIKPINIHKFLFLRN